MLDEVTTVDGGMNITVMCGPLTPKELVSLEDMRGATTSEDGDVIDTALLPLGAEHLNNLEGWYKDKAQPFAPGVPHAIFTWDLLQWMGEYPFLG